MKGATEGTDYINANYLDVSKLYTVGLVFSVVLFNGDCIFALSSTLPVVCTIWYSDLCLNFRQCMVSNFFQNI